MKLKSSELVEIIKQLKVDNTEKLLERIKDLEAEIHDRQSALEFLTSFRDRALAKGYVEEDYNMGDEKRK